VGGRFPCSAPSSARRISAALANRSSGRAAIARCARPAISRGTVGSAWTSGRTSPRSTFIAGEGRLRDATIVIADTALGYQGARYVWGGAPGTVPGQDKGTDCSGFANMVMGPELFYPDGSYIRLDLQTLALITSGGVSKSQMVFTGAKRKPHTMSDPVPSAYKYYEKPYAMPYTLSINSYGTGAVPLQIQIPINDFDFELRRIELAQQSNQQSSQFKVTLYDNNRVARSNLPVLSNMFFHLNPQTSSGEFNFWPCPPILFPVDGAIYFDIWSLLASPTVLPQTFQLMFHGVRRIPC